MGVGWGGNACKVMVRETGVPPVSPQLLLVIHKDNLVAQGQCQE